MAELRQEASAISALSLFVSWTHLHGLCNYQDISFEQLSKETCSNTVVKLKKKIVIKIGEIIFINSAQFLYSTNGMHSNFIFIWGFYKKTYTEYLILRKCKNLVLRFYTYINFNYLLISHPDWKLVWLVHFCICNLWYYGALPFFMNNPSSR